MSMLRKRVQAKVADIVEMAGWNLTLGYRNAARHGWTDEERELLLFEGAKRLQSEMLRRRARGRRRGYPVQRGGHAEQLALLEQTFPEARLSVAREEQHAAGSAERAAWDRYLLEAAEERCRERGLEPSEIDLKLRDFIDDDEADELWARWRAS